ncbi:conserved hypothetical protein [Tenacibaculum finnmarkense]|nr:conserved hypothetical protein [Tenacibaculum finnmarkense]
MIFMKINNIFAIIKDSLISVKYINNDTDEFERIFDDWTDVEFLSDFFEEHILDLQSGFFGEINIEQAIERTIQEAEELEQTILEISERGKTNDYETLQTLFKPLNNKDYKLINHLKTKAYGSERKSWLRIYAIRIAKNTFVISGGAIKLTPTMNEREHLKKELQKLEIVKEYLIENGLFDQDDFEYLEIK